MEKTVQCSCGSKGRMYGSISLSDLHGWNCEGNKWERSLSQNVPGLAEQFSVRIKEVKRKVETKINMRKS